MARSPGGKGSARPMTSRLIMYAPVPETPMSNPNIVRNVIYFLAGVAVLVLMPAFLAVVCLLCEWIYVLVGVIVR